MAAQGPAGEAPAERKAPTWLVAEPAPSDNGMHVVIRWPRPEGEPSEQRYAVYVSRDPKWRWFMCGAVSAGEGAVTGPVVSPFYPYRFRDDGQVYYVTAPLEVPGLAPHWLAAESRCGGWLAERRSALQKCESSLAALKDRMEEWHECTEKLAVYRPRWEKRAREPGPKQSTFAGYLADAEKRTEGAVGAVAVARQTVLEDLAGYLLVDALIRSEARAVLSEPSHAEPSEAERLLAAAEQRAQAPSAGATQHDEYDKLSYMVAVMQARQAEGPAAGEAVVRQVLSRMSDLLSEADLAQPAATPEQDASAVAPDDARLTQALADWHQTLGGFERDAAPPAAEAWQKAQAALEQAVADWRSATLRVLQERSRAAHGKPERDYLREEMSRLRPEVEAYGKRLKRLERAHARRPYCFRLAPVDEAGAPGEPFGLTAWAAARPALFDASKLVNLIYAVAFTTVVLLTVAYVRRHPDVFVRRIPGLEAVDEAIGRATEMGKPILFVHGLTGVGDIAVLASINILGRIAREVAQYDSDLVVVNTDPIVYSLSQEVMQEAYLEAGRPDAFNRDNVVIVASEQFPYVAAVAGIMARRRPAANFLMGYFYAEALILAEAGASTGAIQIAATDSFTQLPFFITTCDYTLMGEELYAASAYLSRNARMLATLRAQDLGKAVLLAAMPAGIALSNLGLNWIHVIFRAYEKGF